MCAQRIDVLNLLKMPHQDSYQIMGFSQPAGELNRLTYMVSSKRSTQVHFEDINYAVVLKSKNKKDKWTKKQEDIANTGN